jgi:hypothetical protein
VAEQQMFRRVDAYANAAIGQEVAKIKSARLTFVPVTDYFAGHEVCGKNGEWINGPTVAFQRNLVNDQSFHPNSLGQDAYAACVNALFLGSGKPCQGLTF